jgi:hypothetical protein
VAKERVSGGNRAAAAEESKSNKRRLLRSYGRNERNGGENLAAGA